MVRRNLRCSTADRQLLLRWQTDAGIPAVLVVGTPFWERTEVRDLLAYARLAAGLADDVALGRIINVPKCGLGEATQAALRRWADAQGLPWTQAMFGTSPVRVVRTSSPFGWNGRSARG